MRRPLQIEVESRISHRVEIRSLDQPFAVIGRDSDCDVVLRDRQVSRRHAYLQVVGGRLFWVDLDSQLGTFVEGHAWKSGWLGDGRTIAVGPNDIRQLGEERTQTAKISAGPPHGSPLIWRNYGDEPLADVTVEFLNGPSVSKTWPIRRVLSLIGTARRCKFRLADRSIEPFHCALLRTSQGLFVVDLLGGEGIKVNEVPARWAHARDGDMVQVGRYQIRIHYRAPEPGPEMPPPSQSATGEIVDTSQIRFPVPAYPVVGPTINPGVEIIPFERGANFPASTERNDLTEAVLVPLVSQFGMMQQQMFDQFQQTMTMLVQMFGKMHEGQMELIRQEFDRLNDLTKEIDGLKAELAEMTRSQAGSSASMSSSSPTPIPRPTIPIIAKSAPSKPAIPSDEEGVTRSPIDPASTPHRKVEAAPGGDRDAIVWLHQRITSIQNEREGRWQKLLKLIPGNS